MLSTHTDDNTYIYVCYTLCVCVMLSTCVYVCECVYIFLSVCVEVCIPPGRGLIYLYCHRQKFLTEITFSVDKSNFYVTILFMNTKQIRISEKAYKELESRKDKTGVNIRRQVDDLVLKQFPFKTHGKVNIITPEANK